METSPVKKPKITPEYPGVIPAYTGWVTEAEVLEELGMEVISDEDRHYLSLCVKATNRAIAYWRPDITPPVALLSPGEFTPAFSWSFEGGTAGVWGDDPMIKLGAMMLATRWFQRKGGIDFAAFAEFGGPPPAVDKDIEHLLRINRSARPVVA